MDFVDYSNIYNFNTNCPVEKSFTNQEKKPAPGHTVKPINSSLRPAESINNKRFFERQPICHAFFTK